MIVCEIILGPCLLLFIWCDHYFGVDFFCFDTLSPYLFSELPICFLLVEVPEYGVGRGIPDAPLAEANEFLNNRNNEIAIDKYVIMPNHAHLIVLVNDLRNGASRMPRPTNALIPKLISSIKRFTNKQAGFFDHISLRLYFLAFVNHRNMVTPRIAKDEGARFAGTYFLSRDRK